MQGDFGLSKFQLGVLAALFMVGLMAASLVLTQLTGFVSPFRLIGALSLSVSVPHTLWTLPEAGNNGCQVSRYVIRV